jgi:hypothetical protein
MEKENERNLKKREKTREKLLTLLGKSQEVYKPKALEKINERISNHITEKESLQKQLDDIKKQLAQKNLESELKENLQEQYKKNEELMKTKEEIITQLTKKTIEEARLEERLKWQEEKVKLVREQLEAEKQKGAFEHFGIAVDKTVDKLEAIIVQRNCLIM